jgi:hypothetical protein
MAALAGGADTPLSGWQHEPVVARVRSKLDRLRAALRERGEQAPDPPLVPEADLLGFEMRHGITLPAEYRAFLLRVGNEELGTGTGLIPLQVAADIPNLRLPFPYSPTVIQQLLQELLSGWPGPITDEDEEVEMSDLGCLCIVEYGGSNESYLLGVNGAARGQVWTSGDWYSPLPDDQGELHNFLSWYEEWLDKSAYDEFGIRGGG